MKRSSPDGKLLATEGRGSDGSDIVKIWEIGPAPKFRTLKGHQYRVERFAFSPDGQRLFASTGGGRVKDWDLSTTKETLTFDAGAGISCTALSLDCQWMASGSQDGTLTLWDLTKMQAILTIKGEKQSVTSVALSPDCKRIVSGTAGGIVKIWDVETRQEVLTLKGHTSSVKGSASVLMGSGWHRPV